MNDTPTVLRRLADLLEENEGQLPEALFSGPAPRLLPENRIEGKKTSKEVAQSIVHKTLYAIRQRKY